MTPQRISDVEHFAALMYGRSVDDLYLVPYGYPVTFLDLAAGGVDTAILNLSANADFILLGMRHFAFITGDTPTIITKTAPDVTALVTDTSSGDQFTNGAAQLENISTNGGNEVQMQFPRLLSGRGALSVQVRNQGGDALAYLQVYLYGVLVRAWNERPVSPQMRAAGVA